MTRDEAFQEYQEALDKLSREYNRARDEARGRLNIQLVALRKEAHEELKAIRAISQKTKRR